MGHWRWWEHQEGGPRWKKQISWGVLWEAYLISGPFFSFFVSGLHEANGVLLPLDSVMVFSLSTVPETMLPWTEDSKTRRPNKSSYVDVPQVVSSSATEK